MIWLIAFIGFMIVVLWFRMEDIHVHVRDMEIMMDNHFHNVDEKIAQESGLIEGPEGYYDPKVFDREQGDGFVRYTSKDNE